MVSLNSDPQPPSTSPTSSEAAYHDLRRLIPSFASELDGLRTSLREHNRWIQRYGHASSSASVPEPSAPVPDPIPAPSATSSALPELPAYSVPDVPPYTASPQSAAQEVIERRDQIMEWLREGEDLLREYSARFVQVGRELGRPYEDVLGTWIEGQADANNALPDYQVVEEREELMVGGVGEVPPPYVGSEKRAPGPS